MSKITEIQGRKILDSRGKPTVEVKVRTEDGLMGVDAVPSGTSTGKHEAALVEPDVAIANVNKILAPQILGMEVGGQDKIDRKLLEIDGTKNKSRLGANAILGISLAVARAAALEAKMPLFWYLNKFYRQISKTELEPAVPTPMMVMVCGGKHGGNNLCIQEFLLIGKLEDGIEVWKTLEKNLKKRKIPFTLGLEGAFSPKLSYDEDALDLILEAIREAKLNYPGDVRLGLDIAGNNCQMNNEDLLRLVKKYQLFSLEDPFGEDDWEKFSQLKLELGKEKLSSLIIGDDLFATHKELLEKGINEGVANGIIIKVNQVGTLTETIEVIALAQKAKYIHIVSHRSGETTDTFIADLAVATASQFLKSGAPVPKERLLKYKRLKEIEGEL